MITISILYYIFIAPLPLTVAALSVAGKANTPLAFYITYPIVFIWPINTFINPFIYYKFNAEFREAYRSIFKINSTKVRLIQTGPGVTTVYGKSVNTASL